MIRGTAYPEINVLGAPGITVPAGRHANGAPFALFLIGRAWDEAGILSLAHAFEQECRARRGERRKTPPA